MLTLPTHLTAHSIRCIVQCARTLKQDAALDNFKKLGDIDLQFSATMRKT